MTRYKLVDGQLAELTPDELTEREAEEAREETRDKRPLAMGIDLLRFINVNLQRMTDDAVLDLLEEYQSFITLLQTPRANPTTQKFFDKAIVRLERKLKNADRELIMNIINSWKGTVRFAPDPLIPQTPPSLPQDLQNFKPNPQPQKSKTIA